MEVKRQSMQLDDNPFGLPFELGYLTPEMAEEARTQLHETDDTKERCLNEIRRLLEKEVDLVCRTDDNFLLQFLRARKFNVKNAFKLLQNYFQFRKQYKRIYDSVDPESIKEVLLRDFCGYFPKRDRKGSVVFLIKFGLWDPEIDSFDQIFRVISALLVHGIEYSATQVTGFRVIIDCRGMSWKQIRYFTPQNAVLLVRSTQFCFPARFKGIHIFGGNRLFSLICTLTHPFLTNKLKERIIYHGKDVETLYKYIHPSVLPNEYGGTQGPFDNSSWKAIMDKDAVWMTDMLKHGYK